MRKLFFLALIGAGVVAFVGADAIGGALRSARDAVRAELTANVPLKTQLAEARAQVDAYAESVIRGEVAAENLAEMIAGVEREVRVLETRVERQRVALVDVQRRLEVVPTSTGERTEDAEALRLARTFRAASELLERRRQDLDRLKAEQTSTLASLSEARAEQARLAEEVKVLAAEIQSLDARTAAARTREAVGDAAVSSSGFAGARARLDAIRTQVREKNKLLQYYAYERAPVTAEAALVVEGDLQDDPRQAVAEALAAWPRD
jgi:predicted  nucleic acid-binding Zn-ribbon protein